MSGKAPTPFQAICNSWSFATAHFFLFPAYALFPAPGFHHRIRKQSERLDSNAEISRGSSQEVAWPWLFACRATLYQGFACATPLLSLQPLHAYIRRNKSIFGFGQAESGSLCRKPCTYVRLSDSVYSPTGKLPRISGSKIRRSEGNHGASGNSGKALSWFAKRHSSLIIK